MKKFLNIFFAAALILVSAQSLYAADLKVNGEFRVRGYSYNSVTGQDYGQGDGADYLDSRFLLNGSVTQGMTSGVFELMLNSGCFSCSGSSDGGATWGNGYGASGNSISFVHQAYMNVTFPAANLIAGRSILKLGHGIILNETADNLSLKIPLSILSIDLAYLKIVEPDYINNSHAVANDLDRNGYLINVGLKPMETFNINLFYVTDSQKVTVGDNQTLNVYGLSADGQLGPVGLNFEYDGIGGTAGTGSNFKGSNILVAAHANVAVAEVGIGYLRVTGAGANSTDVSSNSIAGDFNAGHGILLNDQTRYGNGVDLNTRVVDANYGASPALNNNFHALKLFAETMPTADINVGLEIFPLIQLVDGDVFNQYTGYTDTNVGQEANIYGGYKLDKNLSLTAAITYFMTGDVVKDLAILQGGPGADKKNVTKLNAALTYTF